MKEPIQSRLICACMLVLGLASAVAQSPPLRFWTKPYRVFEGDAVRFLYLQANDVPPKSEIGYWWWDFNGDGFVDAHGSDPQEMDQTWHATLDPLNATNGVQFISPVLRVVTVDGTSLAVTNITEDTYGGPEVDPHLIVRARSAGNPEIKVGFSGNPRVTTSGATVRFFADVTLLQTGRVDTLTWDFGDGFEGTGPNPSHRYDQLGLFTVSLTVDYILAGTQILTNSLSHTNLGYVWIVPDMGELSMGRSYRRGFPEEYNWDDIIKAYSAASASGDRYVYFHYFEQFFDTLLNSMGPRGYRNPTLGQRRDLAEVVNEILQGQSLLANQRLIEALRIKYPVIFGFDPDNPPDRLPVPPGVREETAAIDVSLLDYHLAMFHVLNVVHEFGVDILRSRAEPGREPFPDFPRYLTFIDATLSPQPVPIKNEFWQLTSLLDKMSLGTVEKAKRLYRLSLAEPAARQEAKEECKKAGLQGYLGMALLAAGQNPTDFAMNEGNSLLAHVKNARDLFEQINAGLNPLGNDGSFIPNESFAAIYQDAQDALADAREAEINARQESRTYDQYQADLRNEQQSQRAQFITPLRNLTGLDPAEYNNLATVDDQIDFRNTIHTRVQALLDSYPNANPSGLGEYGAQVISVFDAGEGINQAINRLGNLYESIKISEWANAEIDLANETATQRFKVNDIARGFAEAFTGSKFIFFGGPTGGGTGLTFNLAALAQGFLNADDRDIQRIQNARIADVQLEAEIRKSLLEVANLAIDIRRAKNSLDVAQLTLEQMLSQMDRLVEDLAHARDTAANLYFQDPSFRVVVSHAQRRAEAELDYAIDRLYRLAKTLEYEWTEPYKNPVTIPINCQEPPSLENTLFDKFTELDSLFIIRTADESKDYLNALQSFDSKLRRINVTSVRGPNHAGPLSAEPISVREQVLGLSTTGPNAMSPADSLRHFRDYLARNRQTNYFNALNPSLEFVFSTGIADNSYFPSTGSRWNMRIATISIDLYADSGFSPWQVAEIDLIESGMVSLRRFWAEPPLADDLMHLTFNVGRADRTAFSIVVPAKINGAMGGRPPAEFIATGLANRPIAATRWILKIDTENPSNRDIDFTKLKDIVVRFTYTYGNPPEFPGF
ncbi:MAG: PKD domain-containing protein [Verrucomicrobia bacterium]|nr:PKD domain-containing protein [Verrucomicrobiota bacterium]